MFGVIDSLRNYLETLPVQYIVVSEDPSTVATREDLTILPRGEILDGDKVAAARRRRVALLPVDSDRILSSNPSFAFRPWGTGWRFDASKSERGCPLLVAVNPAARHLYWYARLAPIRPGVPMKGSLRLVADTTASGALVGGLSQAVTAPAIGTLVPGPAKGLIIGGRNAIAIGSEGYLAVALHGIAENVRVLWLAVSATPGDFVEVVSDIAL